MFFLDSPSAPDDPRGQFPKTRLPVRLNGRCLFLLWVLGAAVHLSGGCWALAHDAPVPSVLVLHDGPEVETNPGRIDSLFIVNLLGHFTTRRTLISLDKYRPGSAKSYDAVFCIVYQKKYQVPKSFLLDMQTFGKPFCWLGNQVGQLASVGILQHHGLAFERLLENTHLNQVIYKGHNLDKGDPDTNLIKIVDPTQNHVLAWAMGPDQAKVPYIIQSKDFWIVADSPFSYSNESDRMLAFCDVLHDILHINHAEDHRALLRIEDINALSKPQDLKVTLNVIRKHRIPFSFGYVPMYINPNERIYLQITDKPDVVKALQNYARAGGSAVLHGFTHQHRGATTDDYEFWDDLRDKPIRGDSRTLVTQRLDQAIKISLEAGLYPLTWETPHYAASPLDYQILHQYFSTVYERRIVVNSLDSDQLFPYPVIDLYGQYVIPEALAYIPKEDPRAAIVLRNAEAMQVVRDGYASFFFHPFLDPSILDELIVGVKKMGYHFVDLKTFPNTVKMNGCLVTTQSEPVQITGRGKYLNEEIWDAQGDLRQQHVVEIPESDVYARDLHLNPGDTYVAIRQEVKPAHWFGRLIRLAKGDLSVLQKKWETVLPWRSWADPSKTVILWNPEAEGEEAIDQESFYNALSAVGFDIKKVDAANFPEDETGPFTLLVIPKATAQSLPQERVDKILMTVHEGINLITDGESPLSESLGVRLAEPIPVDGLISHLYSNETYSWADRPKVPYLMAPLDQNTTLLYSDHENHPVAIEGSWGMGKYLYFAPLYDPLSRFGYSRFPDMPSILVSEFHLSPLLKRSGADAYFDPGYRQNVSIERLAPMWRRFGIHTIHAAAWHFYDKYTYDYARLIRVAHQNGIRVNAWFEWPHVSEHFWNKHPEWREKTALLTDAHVDWRFLMSLQNPQCLKTVLGDMTAFLKQYDWDGVNLAEFEFESTEGPTQPGTFTPFNSFARKEFERDYGFDPLEIMHRGSTYYWRLNSQCLAYFYEYRSKAGLKLLDAILKTLDDERTRQNRSWEIVVTAIDTLPNPELADRLAMDVEKTIKLVNRYNAILQIEDPATEWSKSPDRYTKLGQRYKTLLKGKPYIIDINVLPVHDPSQQGFASAQPTGSELLELWRTASSQAPRVCFYSESTLREQDWEILPYAMASDSRISKEGDNWIIESPSTVIVELGRGTRGYRLDGHPWPCVEKGEVLVPPGRHNLTFSRVQTSWFDTAQLETQLLSMTGELLGCQQTGRGGMEIEYTSPSRCLIRFSKQPYKTILDDIPTKLTSLRTDDGFVIVAPPGQHRLKVTSQSILLYAVEFMSLISASLIVLFGMVSSSLLAILFLFISLHRRMRKIRQFIFAGIR